MDDRSLNNDRMGTAQMAAVNAQLIAIKECESGSARLRTELQLCTSLLEEDVLKFAEAMDIAIEGKEKGVAAIRAFRKVVEYETSIAIKKITAVQEALTERRLSQLREFVDLMERLNAIDPNILVGKLFESTERSVVECKVL